jgi:hypothetical protein
MSDIKIENYVDAMLETSSVALHDISGQIHVIQFCVEELNDHLDKAGSKYIERLQDSLDEVTDLLSFYKGYVKKASLSKELNGAEGLIEGVLSTLQVNFWNEFKKIKFDLSGVESGVKFGVSEEELHSVLFSLLSLYLDELKKAKLERCTISIGLKVLDSQHCKFTLESAYLVDRTVFETLDDSFSPGEKAFRKNMGHAVILNSNRYQIETDVKNELFSLSMKMKVISE